MYAVARYQEGEQKYIDNYLNGETGKLQGLCGIDVSSCSNPSQKRLIDYLNITSYSIEFFPVYIVKRNIGVSNLGQKYVYFTYSTGMLDSNNQFYGFASATSSIHLNNNMLIKEIRDKYKTTMENSLGGWSVR